MDNKTGNEGQVSRWRSWYRRNIDTLQGLRTWGIAVMVQAVLPLCAFLPEYAREGKLSTRTLGAGSTLYVLGLGLACRDPFVFVFGMLAGLVSALVYGSDPNFVDPKMDKSSLAGWLPYVLVILVAFAFLVDRFYCHVLLLEDFGPFRRRTDGESRR